MNNIMYYTDGACSVNTGKGGYAYARIENGEVTKKFSQGENKTTNNRMELKAIIGALKDVLSNEKLLSQNAELTIKSDSQYCINAITKWIFNWVKNNFFEGVKGREVKNIDLWKEFINLRRQVEISNNVKFEWVKGHSTNEFNCLVDNLAVKAKNDLK